MRSPLAAAASLLVAGSLVLSGCSLTSGGDDEPAPAPKTSTAAPVTELPSTAWTSADAAEVSQGGTLRLAASALPANFNPLQSDAADSDAAEILAPTSGGAVRITADGGWEVDPDYAESVEVVDEDPLTVEVRLNPKAVWQGGTSITADDMVAFWKAQNGSDDAYEVISTAGYDAISAVEPGDDEFSYTVTFSRPTAEWPLYVYPRLASNVSASPKLFNQAFRTRAISSNGPFVVTSIDPDAGVVTQKPNPRWWGTPPKLDEITWNVGDAELQAEAYVNDELDAVDLQASTYRIGRGTGTVQRAAGVEWSQVTLNGGRGPLRDVRVRRAVAHAIDRDAIATTTAKALGAPAAPLGSLLLVPGQKGYQDSTSSIAHDPAEAKKLLEAAGYTAGADGMLAKDGEPLTLTLPVPEDTPTNNVRASAIADDLRAVGIAVTLRPTAAATFFDDVVIPLDFDLVTFVNRASPFPITAAKPLFFPLDSAQNYTGIAPDRIGPGFDTVLGTLDDALRIKRVAKLDEWLFEDVPMIPLAVTPVTVAVRNGLVNYGAAQFEQPDWTTVGFVTKPKKAPADD
ncbi:ABC transporter family substrate-binding protein [Aeromicrobium sp. CFBP 8757]|uniref:ABC transporter family substrate-binding protein n=1 Tax=Aeromicrobium sp. CFBP 8757 TaxID=2775288 RepID=UPI00177BD95D|nr:ABC transporter family substrate-binding protein [Aeromicrobium sp. CFBP 8757]MBD8608415.1 ABC transporter family substrate-binding protein [Aeromicrobium sp. CFBP 8757]